MGGGGGIKGTFHCCFMIGFPCLEGVARWGRRRRRSKGESIGSGS